jgi:uncharacterized protein (TIGR02300 family)
VSRAELGVKRRCLSCNKAFFDLSRTPPVCPTCGAAFEVIEIAHSRPRRPLEPDRLHRQSVIEKDAGVEPVLSEEAPTPFDEPDLDDSVLPTLDGEGEEIQVDPEL